MKNKEKGNINNKTGYRKKRDAERLVHDNISGLTNGFANEKYRKSFFQFVNDREGKAFTKENLSFLCACERGITLLALIITVVILIILATVTINITLNNGLINQAKQAGEDTMQAAEDEQQMLDDVASYINGILADTNKAKTLVQAFKDGEIQVGDYVDYTPDLHDPITVGTDKTGYTDQYGDLGTTNQTYSQDTTNTHWRVLGLTEDGNSVVLLGSQIKKDGDDPYLVLQGARGYLSAESTLNEICGLYHNSALAQETRSIKIEDINRALGGVTVDYEQGTVTLDGDSSKTNIGETTSYSSYTYQSGDRSPESYPAQVASEEIGTEIQANAYNYNICEEYEDILDYNYLQSLGTTLSEEGYNMLFEGTIENANYAKAYWLASNGCYSYESNAGWGIGVVTRGQVENARVMHQNIGRWGSFGFAVRPLVVLNSDVTVEQIHKIPDQSEQEWNTEGGHSYGSTFV